MENWIAVAVWIQTFGLKILTAGLILVLGGLAAKFARRLVKNLLAKSRVDATLVSFVSPLVYYGIMTFVVLAALGELGIETASLIAILGAAGLAVGLAIQGSLSNFAAGVLIVIFRPFKINDLIEGAGVNGFVEEIEILTTTVRTLDNRTVIIPNSKLYGDNITNYSTKPCIRIDLVVGVAYEADIDQVKRVISNVLAQDERIFKTPTPTVAVMELADSSVNFAVRPWVKATDYWDVYFATLENVKKQLDDEGISIPFPQRDVHLYQH